MPIFLNGSAAEAAVEAVRPALSVLEKSVIGAVLIVALALMVASIIALIRVQNARVADQKEASERLESSRDKMVEAFGKFKGTLEALERSEDTSQKALQALSRDVSSMSGKVDLLIALRGQGHRSGE